jgi:predicted RNase H-like nuclease
VSAVEPICVEPICVEPVFVGLDLAWGARNPSGGAVLRDGQLVAATGALGDDNSILAFVGEHLPPNTPCVVAIDAPLRVPNVEGRRRCDAELSAAFRSFEAGALPANRSLPHFRPEPRGERLVRLLRDHFAIVETDAILRHDARRLVCEVFPHPAHVVLFGLQKTLKYKAKPGRSAAALAEACARYQTLLAGLAHATPPLLGLHSFVDETAPQPRGRARKEREDLLDAVTCAYVVWWAWWHGPPGQRWFGSLAEGSILTPHKEATAAAVAPFDPLVVRPNAPA